MVVGIGSLGPVDSKVDGHRKTGRLISTMEFSLLVRFHLYIESDPRFCIITDASVLLLQDIPVYLMRATRGICAAAARRARAAAREAHKNAGPPNENVSHSGSHCRGSYSGALSLENHFNLIPSLIARFMGPTWGPSGADRTQVGPCWPHELCYLGWINDYSISSASPIEMLKSCT